MRSIMAVLGKDCVCQPPPKAIRLRPGIYWTDCPRGLWVDLRTVYSWHGSRVLEMIADQGEDMRALVDSTITGDVLRTVRLHYPTLLSEGEVLRFTLCLHASEEGGGG